MNNLPQADRQTTAIPSVYVAFEAMLSKRPKNEAGEPTCSCGAVLTDNSLHCVPCWARVKIEREKQAQEESRQFELERTIKRVGHGLRSFPRWPWAHFGSEPFERLIKQSPRFRAAAAKWQPSDGSLAFLGITGSCKTTVVNAMMHRLKDAAIERVTADPRDTRLANLVALAHWVTAHTLANARRAHGLGQGEAEPIETAMGAGILCIDELGFESQHDTAIFEVLDHRYRKNWPTIITSGLRPAEIAGRYGDAFWRRIAERGTVVEEWGKAGE